MRTNLDHAHPVDPGRVREAQRRVIGADDATRLSGLLALLGDPVRVRILYALDVVEELCVGDVALALDVSEDAASYGLRMLRTSGMVQTRKDGRVVYYRLAETFPEPLLEHCLAELISISKVANQTSSTRARSRAR
jgi:ArsR family transcriptional regulator, lead/cadmium/zinc/bismuth-responsive transcriptional repressor